ncbi:MAG: hypothetical protein FJ035_02985 [Chloroflexi bacterium]|nr:hypothetical protein [Chloroflexota bacterium]
MKLIRFERVFAEKERDPFLERRLAEELPGILAWAVRGAIDWKVRGLDPPRSVLVATETYRAESDPLADFIASQCVVADGCSVGASALYAEYAAWAERLGMPARERLTTTTFGRRVGERFTRKSTKRGNVYTGIGLLARVEGGGLEGNLQELFHDEPREEEFSENPPQPSTLHLSPTCDDGCGTPVAEPGQLCDACADAALRGDPL